MKHTLITIGSRVAHAPEKADATTNKVRRELPISLIEIERVACAQAKTRDNWIKREWLPNLFQERSVGRRTRLVLFVSGKHDCQGSESLDTMLSESQSAITRSCQEINRAELAKMLAVVLKLYWSNWVKGAQSWHARNSRNFSRWGKLIAPKYEWIVSISSV